MYCITTRQSRRQLLSDFYCYKLQLQQSTYKGHARVTASVVGTSQSAAVSAATSEATAAKAAWYNQRRLYRQLRLKKCSEYWSGRIEADQSDPRKLLTSVDTLLGRGRLPASSAIEVASFSRFFADKVAKVRSSTSSAPPPTFSRLQSVRPSVTSNRRRPSTSSIQRYMQAAWQVIGCRSTTDFCPEGSR